MNVCCCIVCHGVCHADWEVALKICHEKNVYSAGTRVCVCACVCVCLCARVWVLLSLRLCVRVSVFVKDQERETEIGR